MKLINRRRALVIGLVLSVSIFAQQAFAQNANIVYELSGEKTATGIYTDEITINYEITDADKTRIALLSKDPEGNQTIEANKAEYEAGEDAPDTQTGVFFISKSWLSANETSDLTQTVYLVSKNQDDKKTSKAVFFRADVTEPSVSITGAENDKAYNTNKTLTFTATDGNLDADTITMLVKRDGVTVAQAGNREELERYKTVLCDTDGEYTAKLKVEDKAGRIAEQNLSFIIDKSGPNTSGESVTGSLRDGRSWFYDNVKLSGLVTKNKADLASVLVTVNGDILINTTDKNDSVSLAKEIDTAWLKKNPSKEYKIVISAKDVAGNTTKKELFFKADAIDPTTSITGVENNAILNSAPKLKIEAEDFNKNEEGTSLKTTIKRNGSVISEITSKNIYEFTPNTDGAYEITGQTTDVAGNVSEPTSVTFILDRVSPSVDGLNVSGPKREGFAWFYSYVDITANSSDDFSGLNSVNIDVNGKNVAKASPSGALSNVLNKTLTKDWIESNESGNGSYSIKVSVTDKAGNASNKKTEVNIDTKTPSISLSGIKQSTHTRHTPTIEAKVSDNYAEKNIIYFEVYRDGKRVKNIHKDGPHGSINNFGTDGDYVVKAYSVDRAGNRSKTHSISFVKDTKAPVVSLSGAKEGSYNRGTTNLKASVKERNYKTVTVKTTLTRKLDGKTSTLNFPVKPTRKDFSTVKALSETGTYTATIYAVDKAGNKSAIKRLTFTVDNTKPKLKITGYSKENGFTSLVAPKIVYSDSYFDQKSVMLTKSGKTKPEGITFKDTKNSKGGSRIYSDFSKKKKNDGIYTLICSVKDKAGNVTTEKVSFKVNRFGSRYKISEDSEVLKGTYTKELLDDIVLNELNVTGLKKSDIDVIKDGAPIPDPQVKKTKKTLNDGTYRYIYRIGHENFREEGAYSINATSEDTVGNFSEYSKDNKPFKIYVDKTAPVISVSGVEDGGTYASGQDLLNVSVSDNIGLKEYRVYFGGELLGEYSAPNDAVSPISLPDEVKKILSITAEDKAGNVSTYEVRDITVSSSAFTRFLTNKPLAIALLGGLPAALVAAGLLVFLKKKRKKHKK